MHKNKFNPPLSTHLYLPGKTLLFSLSILVMLSAGNPSLSAYELRSLKEIREEGVVMQQWDTSCAAAALATVLTYAFQKPVSESAVVAGMLEKTESSRVRARGGFSMLDMKQYVEEHGYTAAAYQQLTLADLRLFHAPIVPINVFGINHYLVVNAFVDDNVLLADPAYGNRRMSVIEFEKLWIDGLAFVVSEPRN